MSARPSLTLARDRLQQRTSLNVRLGLEELRNLSPGACVVIPVSEDALPQPRRHVGDTRQTVRLRFGVCICDLTTAQSGAALSELEKTMREVETALLGWRPGQQDSVSTVLFVSAGSPRMPTGGERALIWQMDFEFNYLLEGDANAT